MDGEDVIAVVEVAAGVGEVGASGEPVGSDGQVAEGCQGAWCGPAAAVAANGAVFLTWTGLRDDNALYFTTLEDGAWYGQVKLTGVGTSSAPAVANYDGRFHVVWKGADDDGGLYTTVFDPNQEGTGIYFLWPW